MDLRHTPSCQFRKICGLFSDGESCFVSLCQSRARDRFWDFNSRPAVNRFRYLRDPLFLCACAAYALNRWLLKPNLPQPLLHNWFNDLLLIPCALPPLLLMHRWLGLRKHDETPTRFEIFGHLVGWAILFEAIGPHLMRGVTGDPWDVAAYSIGAIAAIRWWQ